MFVILGAICGVGVIVFGVLAGFQKENVEEIEKANDDDYKKELLKSTKNVEFNTECTRFFDEHKEFDKYSSYFPFGYIVVKQNDYNIKKNCKKVYGKKTYTDFSNIYLVKNNNETSFEYNIELIDTSKFSMQNNEVSFVPIPFELLEPNTTIQLRDMTYPYNYNFTLVNAVIVVKNTKPFVFVIGLKKVKIQR